MKRRLSIQSLYEMVGVVHYNLLDRSRWPNVQEWDTEYLDEIRRALWGSRDAVGGFLGAVNRELEARNQPTAEVVPLRPSDKYDELKHELEGA